MFNKIIKRGHRKGSKSGSIENLVTVNHSSVTNLESQPPILLPLPQTSPAIPEVTIQNLPKFSDVSSSEKLNLFIKKTQLCCVLCDFNDHLGMTREKEIKKKNLQELVKFIQSDSSKINEQMQENLMRMISVNIFRAFPPSYHENTGSLPDAGEPDEEDAWMEPAWPHLQIVYEILLRYVVSNGADKKSAKRYIDHTFVLKLLDLFDSEDQREREYLKMVLHRIYGRFVSHRPFIRAGINNVFYRFIFETERHCGIGQLLEILGSIINGFALPMKEEHKLFLVWVLLPLHKPKCVASYHPQLTYCVTQFVEKDYRFAETVIRSLLRYWPVTNCQKEVLFLGELEEVLDVMHPAEFEQCMIPLFRQIGRCLTSPHFQVAERALFLWNNEHIVDLIAQNRNLLFPLILEALEKNLQGHWNQAVHGLTANVGRMFQEMDTELYEECKRQFEEKEARTEELEEQRELVWKKLEAVAAGGGVTVN